MAGLDLGGREGARRTPSEVERRGLDAAPDGVWIVIPAFREGGMIGHVVRAVRERYPRVVVVDDGSPDATAEEAGAAGARVVRHLVNRGQGAAIQTGLTFALRQGAHRIVTFDADGQHSVQDIHALLEALEAGGADVALGSRFLHDPSQIPLLRRLLLRGAVFFTRWTTGLTVTDTHNGLRAFTGEAAARVRIRLDRMAHASELLEQVATLGLRWREVPVHVGYTRYSLAKGQSGLGAIRILVHYFLRRSI